MNYILRKVRLLSLVLLLFSCSDDNNEENVNPFSGSVIGTITDLVTNEPLAGVQVCLYPGGKNYITGSDGMFDFQNLQNGLYMIQISKDGYLSTTKTMNVNETNVHHCDIATKKGEPCLKVIMNELDYSDNTTSKTFIISNIGDRQIEWKLYSDYSSVISWDKTSGVLEPKENVDVCVTINKSVINHDVSSFPIFVVSGEEELGAIATMVPRQKERLNSLLVGSWSMVYHEFFYKDDETLCYNSLSENTEKWIFKDDYTVDIYDRWVWPESHNIDDCLDLSFYQNTFEYDQAKSTLRFKGGDVFEILTLDENTLKIRTIEIMNRRFYDYYVLRRNN